MEFFKLDEDEKEGWHFVSVHVADPGFPRRNGGARPKFGGHLVPGGTLGPGMYLVPGGVLGPRGVYLDWGCTWSWGACTWSWGCVYLVWGAPGLGGCTWSGGTWSQGDVPGQVLPPVDRHMLVKT